MRKLIEKFYSLSPAKRLIISIAAIMLIAVSATAYSFYNLTVAIKQIMNSDLESFKTNSLADALKKADNQFLPEHIPQAVEAFNDLSKLYNELLKKEPGSVDPQFSFESLSEEQEKKVVDTIKTFDRLSWEELMVFYQPQIDPTDFREPALLDFKKVRDVARFCSSFGEFYRLKSPENDIVFVYSALFKLGRLTEVISPYLIGKMIAIAVDGIAVRPFKRFTDLNSRDNHKPRTSLLDVAPLSKEEAKALFECVMISLKLEATFSRSLNSEYVFFKFFRARIYEKAPLAAWLLDQIFGDPENEYRRIVESPGDSKILLKTLHSWSHPMLLIAVPNFVRAYEVYLEKLAQKAALAAELAEIAGLQVEISDPYSRQPLKWIEDAGRKKFYSVGPNLNDDGLRDDDKGLYSPILASGTATGNN
ncbi:MAG: hypothetical protein ACOYXC_21190 [Candidatus Rifleibacteriota bacterium]